VLNRIDVQNNPVNYVDWLGLWSDKNDWGGDGPDGWGSDGWGDNGGGWNNPGEEDGDGDGDDRSWASKLWDKFKDFFDSPDTSKVRDMYNYPDAVTGLYSDYRCIEEYFKAVSDDYDVYVTRYDIWLERDPNRDPLSTELLRLGANTHFLMNIEKYEARYEKCLEESTAD
jgi:hypothetical protein